MREFRNAVLFTLFNLTGLLVLGAVLILFDFWLFLYLPGKPVREVRQVSIEKGMSAAGIAGVLQEAGVVSDARKFYLLCRLRRAGARLKAGEYVFWPLFTPDQVVDQITQGKVLLHRVTIPEGSTVRDIAKALARLNLVREDQLLELTTDPDFIGTLGLQAESLEGYLFPETYHFVRHQSPRSMLKAMVRQFQAHFPEAQLARGRQLGLSPQQIVILASMVEKEAVVDAERPLIAAVFLNRLKRDVPLQSDPTAVYDLPDFSGPITHAHLQRQSPYNTYQNRGLPIGPICNPGARSLQAALYPEDVPYHYFVSNNDGTHQFSETLEEHNKAVARYREKKKAAESHSGVPVRDQAPVEGGETGEPAGTGR